MPIVTLGTVEFTAYSKQIDWTNRLSHTDIQTVPKRDWNGASVLYQSNTSGGRLIQLIAEENEAWLNEIQVEQIYTLFNTPGATLFKHNDLTLSVVVSQFQPKRIKGYFDPDTGLQLYTATIDLIEVI